MVSNYHANPVLGVYYYPWGGDWPVEKLQQDLDHFKQINLRSVWLFYDPFYDKGTIESLRAMFDHAASIGLTIVPVLGQYLQLDEHPEVKIVNADGSTSDDPRYWNMGCFRNPTVVEIATDRATRILRDFGSHPAMYQIDGTPVMAFVHESYYRNSVPEFGGDHMHPSCYCEHCRADFKRYLDAHDMDPNTEPPVDDRDPVLWQHWLEHHAQAIPDFLRHLIKAANDVTPVWATHELNDFYPASWQQVYTGTDWWRMGAELDIGHEDMYPLEFDTRYQCYVYNYAKDVMRSALGFDKLIVGSGQAFDSWLGYKLPKNSMSEQIYSAVARQALGLVWWTHMPHEEDQDRYQFIGQTSSYNADYLALVQATADYQPSPAKIALLYSWTAMMHERDDLHSYDTLLVYQLLTQSGYPVDIINESQAVNGFLQSRGYDAVFALGCSALPTKVHEALDHFAREGGLLIADYAPHITDAYPPLYAGWRKQTSEQPRAYFLPDGTPVPVQLGGASLLPPPGANVLARFTDGSPAVCEIEHVHGRIILAGSYLGWDYTNYPGYYDLGKMFPFHVRQDHLLREFIVTLLTDAGITPPVESSNPHVEVVTWKKPDADDYLVFVINHLQEPQDAVVFLPTAADKWQIQQLITHETVYTEGDSTAVWSVQLDNLTGAAFRVYKA